MEFANNSILNGYNVLVTGANGFVGRHLCRYLDNYHITTVKAVREASANDRTVFATGDINGTTSWSPVLSEIDCVVHLAARVHVMNNREEGDQLSAFRAVNVDGTINLARQALHAGVRKFIYLSSIKVNGEKTHDKPFTASDVPAPSEPYGVSKLEAENALFCIAEESGMELVVIRPPMVYGPGAKGNFARLVRLVRNTTILPLGYVKNKRSLLYVDNLCDLITHCLHNNKACGQVITACDGHDLSTPELINLIANVLDKKCYLLPVPVPLLRLSGLLTGRKVEISRLTENLQIDNQDMKNKIGWQPPMKVEDAFDRSIT